MLLVDATGASISSPELSDVSVGSLPVAILTVHSQPCPHVLVSPWASRKSAEIVADGHLDVLDTAGNTIAVVGICFASESSRTSLSVAPLRFFELAALTRESAEKAANEMVQQWMTQFTKIIDCNAPLSGGSAFFRCPRSLFERNDGTVLIQVHRGNADSRWSGHSSGRFELHAPYSCFSYLCKGLSR